MHISVGRHTVRRSHGPRRTLISGAVALLLLLAVVVAFFLLPPAAGGAVGLPTGHGAAEVVTNLLSCMHAGAVGACPTPA